jgi:hypothetical protein
MKTQKLKLIPFAIYLGLGFILLTSLQCKKENLNVLPPATTTGENTMGGYIDGKLFVSRRTDLLSQDPSVTYTPAIPELGFGGRSILVVDGPILGFLITQNLRIGRINLENGGFDYGLLTLRSVSGNLVRYYTESGYIEFTKFDINSKIFSGNFDAIFKSESGQTIHITEGRFDLKAK